MADVLLIGRMYVVRCADIDGDGHTRIHQVESLYLGFPQDGPFALGTGLEISKLDEQERERTLRPGAAPVLDERLKQPSVYVGMIFSGVVLTLIPDDAAHHVTRQRSDHGIVQTAGCVLMTRPWRRVRSRTCS